MPFINIDLVKADIPSEKKIIVLAFGDEVKVINKTPQQIEIELSIIKNGTHTKVSGFIKNKKVGGKEILVDVNNNVLKVDYIDVQQGDGSVIETPQGKVMLVDGGENQMFARYLAGRFHDTTLVSPLIVDCILITHGDGDHFAGLPEIFNSEKSPRKSSQLFMQPKRVYQNGLVKRPGKMNGVDIKDEAMFGKTAEITDNQTNKKTLVITDLADDLTKIDDSQMNTPFKSWKKVLVEYNNRQPITFKHLQKGDDAAFDFLKPENIKIDVLGPLMTTDGVTKGLKFLKTPPDKVRSGQEVFDLEDFDSNTFSASHTINGHSIIFRLTYGDFHFLFSGDLNNESERRLVKTDKDKLQAEVLKVPHHGSADFSSAFLKAVAPSISVISSGDENSQKEYIHPRANLLGSLGRYSKLDEPLIFITELVAFFETKGVATDSDGKTFFAFSRPTFGIVKVRTDGKRLLVFTNSRKDEMKEAYAFTMKNGTPVPADILKI
jgi:beta-lactamase superfamily II metal-dependent hydrolase